MIRHVAAKELHEALLSPKFVVIFVVSSVLVLLSIYTGVERYREDLREHRLAEQLNLDSLTQGTWSDMLTRGSTVVRPPSPLSLVVGGVQGVTGRRAKVGSEAPEVRDSRVMHHPIFAVFGELDLAFVIANVLSLFAILLAFDTISGEKERGTLKLLLSGKASRAEVLAGKMLGGYATLVVPLAIPLLIGALYIALQNDLGWGSEAWLRFGLFLLLGLVYLAVFFVLTILVSSLTSRPATSFLVLLLLWVVMVAIMPRTSVLVASQITPAPSYDEMLVEQDNISRQQRDKQMQRVGEELQTLFERQAPGQVDPESFRQTMDEVQARIRKEIRSETEMLLSEVYADFERRQLAMAATARSLSRVLPTSAFTFASQALAGTDHESQQRFLQAVRTYRDDYLAFVYEQMGANPDHAGGVVVGMASTREGGSGSGSGGGEASEGGAGAGEQAPGSGRREETRMVFVTAGQAQQGQELDLAAMPHFLLALPRLSVAVRAANIDLAILLVILAGCLIASYAAFRRYDPR